MKETEIKLAVFDPSSLLRQLSEMGYGAVGPRGLEDDWLFDFPERSLRHASSLLRLRRLDTQFVLTFKGPYDKNSRYKIREEVECRVTEGESLRSILNRLGLVETFHYQKWRTPFQSANDPHGQVLFDETPIGNYLELEGQPEWIDRVASQLGFSPSDYILKSYATLFFEQCKNLEADRPAMVFAPGELGRQKN